MSVMNVKRATTNFNKGDQAPNERTVGSGGSVAAGSLEKSFGDQNVGEVLNKLADPNFVDPGKKARAVGNNQLDKDAFLKLMLTQMKYQDPQNPMQSHEMAAQLAQFTSLEQLNNIHTTLESMKNQQQPQSNYQALALIGKRVSGDASKLVRAAGDTKQGISFELLGDTAVTKITVKDSGGNVVRKLDYTGLKKGRNSVEWNGLKEDGTSARPGEYKVSIEGISKAGTKVFAKTEFGGKITGLNYTPEGPVLLVGNTSIRLSDVKKIEDGDPNERSPAAMPLGVAGAPVGASGAGPKIVGGIPGMPGMPGMPTAAGIPAPKMVALPGQPQGGGPPPEVMANLMSQLTKQMSPLAGATQPPSEPEPSIAPSPMPASPAAQMMAPTPLAAPTAEAAAPAAAAAVAPKEEMLEPATAPESVGNIDQIPMSSSLMAQLQADKAK